MRQDATGNVFESRGRWYARVSLGGGKRKAVLLPHCHDRASAEHLACFIAGLISQLRRSGKLNAAIVDVEKIVREAADAADAHVLADLQQIVDEVCGGQAARVAGSPSPGTTFGELANAWTSEELAKLYPSHVKRKKSEKSRQSDVGRLTKWILPDLGKVRLVDVRLDHAFEVMRKLPADMRPNTKRHVAQLMNRVLNLAVFPCRILKVNPLPRDFKPHKGTPRVTAVLHPAEDAKLLAAPADQVPLCFRMLFGFLNREGCRTTEAAHLTWGDIDARGKLYLDKNKTNRPRNWLLGKGVRRALTLWKEIRGGGPSDCVFVGEDGKPLDDTTMTKLAGVFRGYLEAAGVDRPQLFERSEERSPIRAHDMRGTFCSVSLANNKTERWVMRRTGHTTSAMISRYDRVIDEDTGRLLPLDRAISELRLLAASKAVCGSGGSEIEETTGRKVEQTQLLSRSGGIGRRGGFKSSKAVARTPKDRKRAIRESPRRHALRCRWGNHRGNGAMAMPSKARSLGPSMRRPRRVGGMWLHSSPASSRRGVRLVPA